MQLCVLCNNRPREHNCTLNTDGTASTLRNTLSDSTNYLPSITCLLSIRSDKSNGKIKTDRLHNHPSNKCSLTPSELTSMMRGETVYYRHELASADD